MTLKDKFPLYWAIYVVTAFAAFYLGIFSTRSRTSVTVDPHVSHQFQFKYNVEATNKSTNGGIISIKTGDDRLSSYEGREIDLYTTADLANEIAPNDTVLVTIDFTEKP
jgi:hypothetical protein